MTHCQAPYNNVKEASRDARFQFSTGDITVTPAVIQGKGGEEARWGCCVLGMGKGQ